MSIGNVHHLGYLVKSIEKSKKAFDSLGYEIESDVFFDEGRLADFCFMKRNGICVELVEPKKESDLFPLLKTYGNKIYHVCYSVENLDDAVEELQKNGFLLFKDKQEAPAISETAAVVFMMHTAMGIIELVQEGQI